MQVLSRCPLGVASILWLPRARAYTLTVVCKATFRLEPDLSPLAEEQAPVTEGDSFRDDDEGKSLDCATDLVPFKRHPEVLLVGHAYAPQGVAVGALVARLTVAEIDKAIDVTGDRHVTLDGSISHPGRFTKMALRWERAAGGPETSNPVGVPMGEEARPDAWGRVALPNLVPAGRIIASADDVVPPACFAPMAPHWPARMARLHRHAQGFDAQSWYARPLPADFDMGYFNAAPQDQRIRELVGTERITLENLHPRYPLLTTRLAKVTPRAMVDWGTGSPHEIPLACDTLLIDTDRGVAELVYRGHVSLDFPERNGWVVITTDESAREPVAMGPRAAPSPGATARASIPAWLQGVRDVNETVAHEGDAAPVAAPLPFASEHDPWSEGVTGELLEGDEVNEYSADRGDFDEEETFASVRGDAPLPVFGAAGRGAGGVASGVGAAGEPVLPGRVVAPGGAVPPVPPAMTGGGGVVTPVPPAMTGGGGAVPPVPPKVPQGPRLGAFRLAASSEHPPAASANEGADIEDAQTVDPDEGLPRAPLPAPSMPVGMQPAPLPPPAVPAGLHGAPMSHRAGVHGGPAPLSPPTFGLGPSGVPPVNEVGVETVAFRRPTTWSGVAADAGRAPTLPFAAPSMEAAARGTLGERAPGVERGSPVSGMPFVPVTPVPRASAPGMTIGEIVAQTRGFGLDAPASFVPESTQDLALQEAPPREMPPPPPMRLGPLATPDMVVADLALIAAHDGAAGEGAPDAQGAAGAASTIGGIALGGAGGLGSANALGGAGAAGATSASGSAGAAGATSASGSAGASTDASGAATSAGAGGDASAGAGASAGGEKAADAEALPLEKYPLERCARITASIARTPDKRAEILETHELDEAKWEPLRAHWATEIKRASERGKTAMLTDYDAAYVAQLEDERGTIVVEEYARIVVATERGTANETLAELGLPEGSVLRIQRVWMGRMNKDPDLRRFVRTAVDAASEG